MRPSEDFARESFARFMMQNGCIDQAWSEGADPPDWALRIEQDTYAVEVVRVIEYLKVGSGLAPEAMLHQSLLRFAEGVEEEALHKGVLDGFYLLHLCPVPDFHRAAPILRAGILEYLVSTKSHPQAARRVLWQQSIERRIYIEKADSGFAEIHVSMILSGPKWQGTVIRDLRELITGWTARKRRKLANVPGPSILLLVDEYHYGDSADWRRACDDIDFSGFHTVARVYLDHRTQILHSESTIWARAI